MDLSYGHFFTVASSFYNSPKLYNFEEAYKYKEKTIKITEKIFPDSHDLAYFKLHFAYVCHHRYIQERNIEILNTAKKALEEAHEIFMKYNDKNKNKSDHYRDKSTEKHDLIQLACVYNALGLNYYHRKEYDTAIKYSEKSYEMFNYIHDTITSNTTNPMNTLAIIYSKLGRLDEAVEMEKAVIDARKSLFKPNQLRFFGKYETLADIYYENNKKEEALEYLNKALELASKNELTYANYIKSIKEKIKRYSC